MEKTDDARRRRRKGLAILVILIALAVVAAAAIYYYLYYTRTHITTDDAYVDGNVYTVASKVSGTVKALYVTDNQFVKKDALILEIDPRDFEVQVNAAEAALASNTAKLGELKNSVETVRRQLREAEANLQAARANVDQQEATLTLADRQFKRSEFLLKKEYISKQDYDQAKTNYEVALAQVKAARDKESQLKAAVETQKSVIQQAEASIPTQQAQIKQSRANLQAARLNLSYTKITAPTDGYITNRSVDLGNQIQPGQPLLAVVPLGPQRIWITANYKETQLKGIKPGERVVIKVDAYPGKTFHGTVNSIMSGSGAVFSLFPPQNATGNFVKVVQRIPVKIVLNPGEDPGHILRIGMSVVPTVLADPE